MLSYNFEDCNTLREINDRYQYYEAEVNSAIELAHDELNDYYAWGLDWELTKELSNLKHQADVRIAEVEAGYNNAY